MSNRERWIVYPLLFFAIMLGVSDLLQRSGLGGPLTGPPRFQQIRCRQLIVESLERQPLAVIKQNEFGDAELSMLNGFEPAVMLRTGEAGGQLLLLRKSDQQALFLGHTEEEKFSGLEAVRLRNGQVEPLDQNEQAIELMPSSETEPEQ